MYQLLILSSAVMWLTLAVNAVLPFRALKISDSPEYEICLVPFDIGLASIHR